jgi:hypothetical protein
MLQEMMMNQYILPEHPFKLQVLIGKTVQGDQEMAHSFTKTRQHLASAIPRIITYRGKNEPLQQDGR